MDNRTLVAFGMLLALVAFALQKHAVDGVAVEKIVTFLSGGITGAMVPRQMAGGKDVARAVAVVLLVGVILLHGCATTGPGPSMGCLDPVAPSCDDPTAYPPLTAMLPRWPFPPRPIAEPVEPAKEATTPGGRLLQKLAR